MNSRPFTQLVRRADRPEPRTGVIDAIFRERAVTAVIVVAAVVSIGLLLAQPSVVRLGSAVGLAVLAVATFTCRSSSAVRGHSMFALALLALGVADGGLVDGEFTSAWRPMAALIAYPLLGRALLEQVTRFRLVRKSDLLIEAILIGSATAITLQGFIEWNVDAVGHGLELTHSMLPTLMVGLDVAVLVIVARSLRVQTARRGPLGILTAGAVALLGGHAITVIRLAVNLEPVNAVPWLIALALVVLGSGEAIASTRTEAPLVVDEDPLFSRGHAGVVVTSLLAAPAVLVVHSVRDVSISAATAIGAALSALVLAGHLISVLRERATGEHRATHDALTELPNRVLFTDRLDRAIAHSHRSGTPVGLIYLDLDGFKDVNDTLGHEAGDELLRITADRLASCMREEDTLARLAGDEFAVLLPHLSSADDIVLVAERLLEALDVPMRLSEHSLRNRASLGVAVYPRDGASTKDLLGAADAAMYRAKELGGGTYELCAPDAIASAMSRLETETALFDAIEKDQLVLHYQPIVDAGDGTVCGAEALVRWQHPEKGMLAPGQFIPIAEQSDLIVLLGSWVIEEACRELARWAQVGFADRFITVNVSSRHFRHDLVSTVTSALRSTGADPKQLVIEITESAAAHDVGHVADRLRELRELGVRAAIDDFGTGYCGLQYLGDLPVSSLKIDRSFVNAMTPRSAAIVAATIAMGHSLGMTVIAEGVETAEQRRFLELSGCDRLQGYHLGRPMPAGDLLRMLRNPDLVGESAPNPAQPHHVAPKADEPELVEADLTEREAALARLSLVSRPVTQTSGVS